MSMSTRNTRRRREKKPNAYVITTKTRRKQQSTARMISLFGGFPVARLSSAHQFITQLNEKVVRSVPPSMFLFAKLMTPAKNWQPPPKRRQNHAAVCIPSTVSAVVDPNAIGKRDAQPMARPKSPSAVGSANGSDVGAEDASLMA